MPQKGQLCMTLGGESLKSLKRAYIMAEKEFRKTHPTLQFSFTAFVSEMALLEIARRGYLEKAK